MSSYEKRSLAYFLLVYLASSLIFIWVGAYLFLERQNDSLIELTKQDMKIMAQDTAKLIIHAQMNGQDDFNIPKSDKFKIVLLNDKNETMLAQFEPITLSSDYFFKLNRRYYLIDYGAVGHFGVDKIIVQDETLEANILALRLKVLIGALLTSATICLIAFYLGKLFLRPMKREIERFNNFIAESAHELNTPVSSLLLMVDLLKNDASAQNFVRLKIIARTIAGIYEDLSYFATKGIVNNLDEMLSVSEVAAQRVTMFEDSAKLKNITINYNYTEFYILIDRSRLTRILDNLLSNAVKYTPNSGLINVKVDKNMLTIEDNGNGISEDFAHKMFDKYSRNDASTGGLGLGLAIVKAICDEYKIDITVEKSQLGGAKLALIWNR